MQHFVIPPDALHDNVATFTSDQERQITRVLRMREGDEVVVLDGVGAQYRARLAMEGKGVRGEIVGPATACREPERHVTLLVAPPKGERWEWLLQKGTEIGVSLFVPIIARYSQPGTATVKPRHREIVREATEQCCRLLVPRIAEPQPFARALEAAIRDETGATILLWEEECRQEVTLRRALPHRTKDIRLIIGPEGGFHPDEIVLARRSGLPLAGLGPLILRTETAALAAATIALSSA